GKIVPPAGPGLVVDVGGYVVVDLPGVPGVEPAGADGVAADARPQPGGVDQVDEVGQQAGPASRGPAVQVVGDAAAQLAVALRIAPAQVVAQRRLHQVVQQHAGTDELRHAAGPQRLARGPDGPSRQHRSQQAGVAGAG